MVGSQTNAAGVERAACGSNPQAGESGNSAKKRIILDHLSSRTRRLVQQLVNGEETTIGGKSIPTLSDLQRALLTLFALRVRALQEKKGGDLTSEVEEQLPNVPDIAVTGLVSDSTLPPPPPRKLGRICTRSFRGIAPAGAQWEYDFDGRSHLLHGPNGCGKSSLFGAICWCLAGKLFRDDGPPSAPESITYYSCQKKPKAEGTRPDALTLLRSDGSISAASDSYSVELELVAANDPNDRVWLQRHSAHGLSSSLDKVNWSPLNEVSELRISDLDIDLQVLMPAKIGHLRFGKGSEVLSLFSKIIGLDDLEEIAEVAARCHTAFTREANAIERNDFNQLERAIAATVGSVEQTAPQYVKELSGYATAFGSQRSVDGIKEFLVTLDARISGLVGNLATDLGIVLPEPRTVEAETIAKQLDVLPGHIDSATTALKLPLSQLLPTSAGLPVRSSEAIDADRAALHDFVIRAEATIAQRLDWAEREMQSPKTALMLMAAEHFTTGSTNCPVCTQDLSPVPAVVDELASLEPLTGQPHLKQSIADLARSLLSDLDQIVTRQRREAPRDGLGSRLRADWATLKSSRFPGLVRTIADRFDESINALSESLRSSPSPVASLVSDHHRTAFPGAFDAIEHAVADASFAIALENDRAKADEQLTTNIANALLDGAESLAGTLMRGHDTNQKIKELSTVRAQAASLHQSQTTADGLKARIQRLKDLAAASTAIKDLGSHVRQETINVVKEVEPVMKTYYERLYDKEHLVLDLVTPGHAANPNVKDEFNIYLRAGNARLPASPFANAGRLRALAICFAFSLHKRRHGTLAFHLLDDPAMSLDDEHKARFVDQLIGPCLATEQVLLATHYESFYKCAESRFQNGERLKLVPRRSANDVVSFEPGDLLQRINTALAARTTNWREMSINIRLWAERTLFTLSGYCPVPFVTFNDMPATITAYASIKDVRVASGERDKIVIGHAAAASNGVGVTWVDAQHLKLPQYPIVVIRADVLAPIAAIGQFAMLDDTDTVPKEGDLVAVRTQNNGRLLRRFWRHDGLINLEATNPTSPFAPVLLPADHCEVRRVIGIFYGGINPKHAEPDTEWSDCGSMKATQLDGLCGIGVEGTSLEPVARDGQVVLVRSLDNVAEINNGDLACVELQDIEAVLKRCYAIGGQLLLCPVNPVVVEEPIVVELSAVIRAHKIVGVLFEPTEEPAGGPDG